MLRIYDSNKELELISKREIDLKIEHDLSTGDKTISFLVPVDSEEAEKLVEEGYIETKELNLVVKEINRNFKSFNVVAKLNVEELEGKYVKKFESVEMTVDNTINSILVGTGWSIVACNVTKKRTTRRENKNAWDLIQEVKKIFNCEITFDSKNKQIRIYESLGSYKGEYIRDDINLINLSAQTDSYDFYTRLEAEGKDGLTFADLNNGKSYVENYSHSSKVLTYFWKDERYTKKESLLEDARAKLAELASPKKSYSCDAVDLSNNIALGDTIELVSKKLKVKEKQRVVKYVEYPSNPANNYVELSNTLINLEDINNKFEKASDLIEDVTNADGTINIDKVSGLVVKVTELTADKINTTQLNAVIADIGTLRASKADITELNAVKANITELTATKASITQLNAVSATIGSLQAETAIIKDLVNGNLTSDNIHSLVLSAEKVTVVNGFIKNAMIDNLDVSKINGGTISTDKFIIKSNDGGIEITGATQQFKDKNNRVRLQLGKDTQGNFNFILRGEDGTTTLIDHTGLKRGAIADGLIINNMLGTGSITGDKVNIGSIVSEVNKDTNTTTIKATKIQLDKEGQTLDIAFNTLKTNVNDIDIGGRNLVIRNNEILDKMVGMDGLIASFSGSSLMNDFIKVEVNENLTFSQIYMEGSRDNYFRYCFYGDDKTTVIKRIANASKEFKEKVPNGAYWLRVSYSTKNKVKIERGNKATDWTEAPEDLESIVTTNTTQITAQQGKIETLISDTTIIEDGTSKKLKDAYASLKLTVNGLNSTVGSHTSSITTMNGQITTANGNIVALQGKVQTVEGKQSTFEQTLNGITQRVTSSESNVTTLQGQMTTANNNITNANNKIDGLQIGGHNLLNGTKDFKVDKDRETGFLNTSNYTISYSGADKCCIATHKASGLTSNNNIKSLYTSFVPCNKGDEFICSVWIKVKDVDNWDVKRPFIFEAYDINGTRIQYEDVDITNVKSNKPTVLNNTWVKFTYVGTITNDNAVKMGLRLSLFRNGEITFKLSQVEIGNKATDWGPSFEDVEADINAIDIKVDATSSKVAEIKTTVDGISQKVSSVETTTTTLTGQMSTVNSNIGTLQGQITTTNGNVTTAQNTANSAKDKIDKLEIGGRNLFLGTTNNYKEVNLGDFFATIAENKPLESYGLKTGDNVTFSLVLNINENQPAGARARICQYKADGTYTNTTGNLITEGSNGISYVTVKINDTTTSIRLAIQKDGATGSGSPRVIVNYKECKLEKGNKATDWTPSPEDVEADINAVDIKIEATSSKVAEIKTTVDGISQKVSATETKVTTIDGKITTATGDISTLKGQVTETNSKVASIESTVNGISSKVSNVESSVTTINGNITSLTSRITTAEQQITATSIVNKVSEAIGNGSVLNTVSTTLDKNGFTVKNGAIIINNKANQTVLKGDSDGNLWVQNTFTVGGNTNGAILVKNSSGTPIFSANKNGTFVKDGTMTISTGNITTSGTGYPEGNKREMSIRGYGNLISEYDYSGSQVTCRKAQYQGGDMSLVADNSNNAGGISFRNLQTAKDIRLQKTTTNNLSFNVTTITLNGDNGNIDCSGNAYVKGSSGLYVNNGWIRTYNSTGWYNETHGGGWHMTDSTWIRTYNGKSLHVNGEIATDKDLTVKRYASILGDYPYLQLKKANGTRSGYIGYGNGSGNALYIVNEASSYINVQGHITPTSTNTFWLGTANPDRKWKGMVSEGGTIGASDIRNKENIERVDGTLLSYNEATKEIKEFQLNHFRRIERAAEKDYYSFVKDRFKPTYYNYKLGEAMGEDGELSIDTETEYNMLKNVGFIAQDYDIETDLVAKEFIIKDEEGQLSYNHMSYVTVGMIALQEAIKKIEILEDKIKRLEAS